MRLMPCSHVLLLTLGATLAATVPALAGPTPGTATARASAPLDFANPIDCAAIKHDPHFCHHAPINVKQIVDCAIALTSFASCELDLIIQDAHGRQYGAALEERAQTAFCIIVVCSTAITTCWYAELHMGDDSHGGVQCLPIL